MTKEVVVKAKMFFFLLKESLNCSEIFKLQLCSASVFLIGGLRYDITVFYDVLVDEALRLEKFIFLSQNQPFWNVMAGLLCSELASSIP